MDCQPLPLSEKLKFFLLLSAIALSLATAQAQSANELFRQGEALDKKNQNQEALAVLLQANELAPDQDETLRLIAKQYSQLISDTDANSKKKELGEHALTYALRAVELAPDRSENHLTLAIVYGRVAQFSSARRKVELSKKIQAEAALAAKLDPQSDYAWHVLGRWNYELANFNPLLKALAQTIYGKFPDATNAQAVECFQKAIAIAPRRVIHHAELGRTYLAMGENAQAKEELERGLALPSVEKDDEETKQRAREALRQLP